MATTPRTFRVDLAYDGTAYMGSQRQPGVRTIQGELERALAEVSGQAVAVALAGRTDRGVHALGQVASFQVVWSRGDAVLGRALQAVTPDDLVIRSVREVPGGFHARFDAVGREYRYRIWNGPIPPALIRHCVWSVRRPLDIERMARATGAVLGTRDYASFAGDGAGVPGALVDTVRTVCEATWRRLPNAIERDGAVRILEFRIAADGFLPHMVRNLVGALVQVGRGQRDTRWLAEVVAARDRRLAPEAAPAVGLTLWRVRYRDDEPGIAVDTDVDDFLGVEGYEDIFAEGE